MRFFGLGKKKKEERGGVPLAYTLLNPAKEKKGEKKRGAQIIGEVARCDFEPREETPSRWKNRDRL